MRCVGIIWMENDAMSPGCVCVCSYGRQVDAFFRLPCTTRTNKTICWWLLLFLLYVICSRAIRERSACVGQTTPSSPLSKLQRNRTNEVLFEWKTLFAYTKHVSDIHRHDAKQLVAKCLLVCLSPVPISDASPRLYRSLSSISFFLHRTLRKFHRKGRMYGAAAVTFMFYA